MKNFNKRLKEIMEKRAITQSELCEKTGIPKSAMCQYISGAFQPKHERTHLIAKALNINEKWLTTGEGSPEKSELELSKENIKFALFNGSEGITDEMYEEVLQFAGMVKLREENKKKD